MSALTPAQEDALRLSVADPPRLHMRSLLAGAVLTADQEQAQRQSHLQHEQYIEQARWVVLRIWLEGYLEGRLKFEDMCRRARLATGRLNDFNRHRLLGQLVDTALASEPATVKARRKGEPHALQQAVIELVDEVLRRDGLPVAPSRGDMSAFERTVVVLSEAGVEGLTPRQIKGWYYGER